MAERIYINIYLVYAYMYNKAIDSLVKPALPYRRSPDELTHTSTVLVTQKLGAITQE